MSDEFKRDEAEEPIDAGQVDDGPEPTIEPEVEPEVEPEPEPEVEPEPEPDVEPDVEPDSDADDGGFGSLTSQIAAIKAEVVDAADTAEDDGAVDVETAPEGEPPADEADVLGPFDSVLGALGVADADAGPEVVVHEESILFETPLSEAPDQTAVLPVIGDATALLPEVDLGPEKRGRKWPWILAAVLVLAILGGAGYGWWWFSERPIIIPDVVGKRGAEATQVLNNVGLSLGRASEIPTDSAPEGTIISQKPEAGGTLKPGQPVNFIVAAPPEQSKNPNVVGVSLDSAARTLAQARLRALSLESYSETVAAGYVMSQLPSAGAELPPGATVGLIVSRGTYPAARSVPKLTGMEEVDAVALIESAGFSAKVARCVDPSQTVGVVLEQVPAARTSAAYGTPVQVLISQGTDTGGSTVPNLAGDTTKQAKARLKALNLEGRTIKVESTSVEKGKVISHLPASGKKARSGSTVDLLVSAGPSTSVTVPSLEGTSSAAASDTVKAQGFSAVFVTTEMSGVQYGVVLGQYPAAGLSQPKGYPVFCLVAETPKP